MALTKLPRKTLTQGLNDVLETRKSRLNESVASLHRKFEEWNTKMKRIKVLRDHKELMEVINGNDTLELQKSISRTTVVLGEFSSLYTRLNGCTIKYNKNNQYHADIIQDIGIAAMKKIITENPDWEPLTNGTAIQLKVQHGPTCEYMKIVIKGKAENASVNVKIPWKSCICEKVIADSISHIKHVMSFIIRVMEATPTMEMMEKMFIRRTISDSEGESSEKETCCICLEDTTNHVVGVHNCTHIFHENCMVEYLYHRYVNCPICRTSF